MSKLIWRILLFITGGLALWWCFVASLSYWDYVRYGVETPAIISHFDINAKGSKFALRGYYTYVYDGKNFNGTSYLPKPYYLNRASAEREVEKMKGMHWNIWVDAKEPTASALKKLFPIKDIFYALCLIGVFLYFTYLRFHLTFLSRSM